MKVGKTNTERGPVVGREQREEVVDRRAVATTQIHTINHKSQTGHTHTDAHAHRETDNTHYGLIREGNVDRKGREKSDMSKWLSGFSENELGQHSFLNSYLSFD